jgi:3-phosphoglycerate kinase
VDFNVPLDAEGKVTDDKRIREALPTIRAIIEKGGKLIIVSHLGRPKNGPEAKFSMKPAAERLSELLGKEVILAKDVIGEDAQAKAAALKEGEILMLENVRFHKEEEKNRSRFAKAHSALLISMSMTHRTATERMLPQPVLPIISPQSADI